MSEVLTSVLNQPGAQPRELEGQVQALLSYLQDRPSPPDARYVALDGGSIMAAVICLDSPGRSALVFVPSMQINPHHRDVVVELLDRLLRAGRQRGVRLFHVLAPLDSPADDHLLAVAGFDRLAELVYLERPSTLPVRATPDPAGLTWTCYDRTTHRLFAEVIQSTYEGSLDCPQLFGHRDIEDIIAGHKDAGEFDPQRWFVLRDCGRPVGCLLLARVRHRSALELVYMGLAPQARGRGLGKAMLRRALQVTLQANLAYLTLAVDAANTPACALYRRFDFAETMRRTAWVLTPKG